MNIKKENLGTTMIIFVSVISVIAVMLMDPIAQDLEYHLFKDQRTIFNVQNFWNVISNLPFLLVGIMGLHSVLRSPDIKLLPDMRAAYLLLFTGVSLVAFGSGYYHLWPGNESLVWDRLPMTIAFMALFSVIISEFISRQLGKLALFPLIIFGAYSVIYWHISEIQGEGDLRLYVLVQFLPMMLILLILLFFKSKFTDTSAYWLLMCAYIMAKVFEYFDEAIYNIPYLLSGHSFKHIVVAFGILLLLRAYNNREPI